MILNRYENTIIKNNKLPASWQSQKDLDELEEFLQQNWEQRSVFYDDGEITSKQQFISFIGQKGIKTQNYIGTIVFNGEQLNIYPKMFRTDIDDQETDDLEQKHLMNNLIRWLEYCNKVEYPFISIYSELNDSEDLREFFITLYIGYVRSALERNLYYQYVDETDDCRSIKGRFDIKDYISRKVPSGRGNLFQCTYSKFEFDNKLNRIIKFTCMQILNATSKKNQKILRRILTKLDDVTLEPCTPADCSKVRLGNMNKNYRIILSMSKMFLLNQLSGYTMDSNESFCFLFPTELLFEGFIGGFMQEVIGEYGGHVRLQQSDMNLIEDIIYNGESLGSAFTMRHDITVKLKDRLFILDTKYKQISRFESNPNDVLKIVSEEPKQTDIYQVCEYARKQNVTDVYLLYPMFRYEENEPTFPMGKSKGNQGTINIHFIRLPFVFEEDEARTKQMLKNVILSIFDIKEGK